ncbi:hypothetical protein LTR22_016377 [Elasticomyces elasticus]|nr:hypothetical protein LTR22_016377 [Elasticomyces elasticus]KAK4932791.1 hypothetical protein LTR49_000745 [Elasticomyces elasticus]
MPFAIFFAGSPPTGTTAYTGYDPLANDYDYESEASNHSKADAQAGWIIISTLTLALAGFMLVFTFWLRERIMCRLAEPVSETVQSKKSMKVLFGTAGIFALIGLIYGIVAVKVHSKQGWPNTEMRMVLFDIHVCLISMEVTLLLVPLLYGGIIAVRRHIRERRRIKEIDMQLGELESGTGPHEGVAR